MSKVFYVLLCVFWVIVGKAQIQKTPIPKLWLKESHGLNDQGKLNGYTSLVFFKDIKVLTKKNVLGRSNTLYTVYKSQEKDSVSLFTLLDIPKHWHIYTNQVITPTEKKITKGNLPTGLVLNFSFNNPEGGSSNNYFLMNNPYNHKNTAIYEVLMYNKHLSDIEKRRVETYLSLKYGISLFDPERYIAKDQQPLWDVKLSPNYNQQIVGVGRSDDFAWHQLTTIHSQDAAVRFSLETDSLEIFKVGTDRKLKDETYVLWGHNGKGLGFKKAEHGVELLEREWMVQSHGISGSTQISVVLPDLNKEEHWLYVSKNQPEYGLLEGERYLGVVKDSTQLVFSGIVWDKDASGYDYFTLGRKAKFDFESKLIPQCFDLNRVEIDIKGGTAPYKVSLKRPNQADIVTVFETATGLLADVKGGVYQIEIQEALGETAIKQIKITKDPAVQISLDREWVLNPKTHKVVLKPKVINSGGHLVHYQWTLNGKLLSRTPQLEASVVGKYQLKVTDNQGCEKEFDTEVVKESTTAVISERWTVYPNPTKAGESFEVNFDLGGISDVVLYTYTLDGKYVNKRDLGKIQTQTISHIIYQPGVYLLVAIIQGKAEMKKIVVQ